MWINSIFSLIGTFSVVRILFFWKSKRIISAQQSEVLIVMTLLINLGFLIISKLNLNVSFIIITLQILFFSSIPILIQYRRKSLFDKHLLTVMDEFILHIRSGRPIRESIAQTFIKSSSESPYFEEIGNIVLQNKTEISFLKFNDVKNFSVELKNIVDSNHRIVEKLKSLRFRIKTVQFFKQKSRQSTLQVKAQSVILSFIYLGMLFYIGFEYGIFPYLKAILISFSLFTFGTILVWRMGGKHKWKI